MSVHLDGCAEFVEVLREREREREDNSHVVISEGRNDFDKRRKGITLQFSQLTTSLHPIDESSFPTPPIH